MFKRDVRDGTREEEGISLLVVVCERRITPAERAAGVRCHGSLYERHAHSLPGNFFRLRLTTPENDWSHLASTMQFLLRRVRRPGFRARTRAEANNFGIRVGTE